MVYIKTSHQVIRSWWNQNQSDRIDHIYKSEADFAYYLRIPNRRIWFDAVSRINTTQLLRLIFELKWKMKNRLRMRCRYDWSDHFGVGFIKIWSPGEKFQCKPFLRNWPQLVPNFLLISRNIWKAPLGFQGRWLRFNHRLQSFFTDPATTPLSSDECRSLKILVW